MAVGLAEITETLYSSNSHSLSRKQVKELTDLFLEAVTEYIKQGEEVRLTGIGSFKLKLREERTGRNPRTGESVDIPAQSVLTFKPFPSMKDIVRDIGVPTKGKKKSLLKKK